MERLEENYRSFKYRYIKDLLPDELLIYAKGFEYFLDENDCKDKFLYNVSKEYNCHTNSILNCLNDILIPNIVECRFIICAAFRWIGTPEKDIFWDKLNSIFINNIDSYMYKASKNLQNIENDLWND